MPSAPEKPPRQSPPPPANAMTTVSTDLPTITSPGDGDQEALKHLHRAVKAGTHWFTAVLEAIALWQSPEETYGERHFRYLVGSEAFDWLLLAERLRSEEHTSELQSQSNLVCRLLLEKK